MLLQIIGQISLSTGKHLFNTPVRSETLNLLLQKLVSRNYKHRSTVWREIYFNMLNRLGGDHECDGQTDGQTEKPLEISRSNTHAR